LTEPLVGGTTGERLVRAQVGLQGEIDHRRILVSDRRDLGDRRAAWAKDYAGPLFLAFPKSQNRE
jgi:hypothetical protein